MELSNTAAERAVIAGVLKYGQDGYIEVEDLIKPDFFTLESNQVVYKCIQSIFEKDPTSKIDVTSILSTAKDINLGSFFSNQEQLKQLRSVSVLDVALENIRKEAAKVLKLAVARTLSYKIDNAKKELAGLTGAESLSTIFSILESKVEEVRNLGNDVKQVERLGDGAEEWLKHIIENPCETVGISSGFPIFDQCLGGGFRRGTANLIVARLKIGKSFLCANIGYFVAKVLGIPVLYLDTEMNKAEQLPRVLAQMSNVDISKIEKGKVAQSEATKLFKHAKDLKEIPLYHRTVAGAPFDEVLALIKRWIIKDVGKNPNGTTKDCLVIYDYFKLMDTDPLKSMQEYQALGFQMTTLINHAIKYDFACLAFAQANRDGIDSDTTATIAGSDRMGWFAANVSLFKAKTEEEIGQDGIENGNRKLIPIAVRHGSGLAPGDYIHMNLRGELGQISELGTKFSTYRKVKKENEAFEVDV